MTRPYTITALLLAGLASMIGLTTTAAADHTRCSSPYVWGHQSYFGDRFVYSHRHAYPRHSYRSSRHYIYYRRVPHFYSSSYGRASTSNYYNSPEYRAYYHKGPYFEPSEYSPEHQYRSPNTRPYTPNCEGVEVESYNDDPATYDAEDTSQPIVRPTVDEKRDLQRQLVRDAEAEKLIERGWALLDGGDSRTAMPMFAKAAMLRSDAVQPRIGYAIAATLEGHDMIAAWAMRRGILTDTDALAEVALHADIAESLRDELERVQAIGPAADDDAKRDGMVIASVLAILLNDEEALDQSLQRLAALDEPATMQALIKASKARMAALSEPRQGDSVAAVQE